MQLFLVMKVAAYIDGFNLYHSLARLKDQRVKWLNLFSLSESFLQAGRESLVSVRYFSAYATWLEDQRKRHRMYVRALEHHGVTPIMGNFKEKDSWCHNCGSKWKAHEEKETDVNIGIHLVADAFQGLFDRALIISRDSDLTPAIRMTKSLYPEKLITIVAPPAAGHSFDLVQAADSKAKIAPRRLEKHLLPEVLHNSEGEEIFRRPEKYSLV